MNPIFDRRCLLLFLAPAVGFGAIHAFVNCWWRVGFPLKWEVGLGMTASAALTNNTQIALMFLILLSAVALTAVVYCCIDMKEHLAGPDFAVAFAAAASISTTLSFALVVLDDSHLYQRLGDGLYSSLIERHFGTGHTIRLLDAYLAISNVAVIWAAIFLAIDATTTLAVPAPADGGRPTPEEEAAFIRAQADRLKIVLYVSTAVLVVGVLEMRSWMVWPAPAIEKGQEPAYRALVAALMTGESTSFVAILAGITAPPAVLIYRRRNALVHRWSAAAPAAPRADAAKWIKDHGLDFAPLDAFKIAVAILGPWLAGSVGDSLGGMLPKLAGS
ncbi:MAG: hypothetical protein ACT4N4_00610 [Rhodospirillales bacterium]